jgi:hypothetical protein
MFLSWSKLATPYIYNGPCGLIWCKKEYYCLFHSILVLYDETCARRLKIKYE